jgi:ribose transport system ATP-binding protein
MRDVRKRFGATVALDGIDFVLRPGEIHALAGENGAGKSTLMKVLSGALQPDGGTMRLDGDPFRPQSPLEARRRGVAMIYQELSLAEHLTVEDNIRLGVEPSRFGILHRAASRESVRAALAQLGHPEIPLAAPVRTLSVAQRQIVEIARALVTGCRVLVLDEPTSSLAREDTERLFSLVRRLRATGIGIVYISHFLEELRTLADRITVLRDGRTAGNASPALPVEELVSLLIGRRLEQLYPRSAHTVRERLLTLDNVASRSSREAASASLTVHRGEVVGIAGLVGAGRTELLRAVFGLDAVRHGEVRVGSYVGPASPARRLTQGVGLLSENRKDEGLAVHLSLAENIVLSRWDGLGPLGLILPGRRRATAAEWVHRMGIRCRTPDQPAADLSGGNQQKVAIARLLRHDVDLLLLDEPTRGIDVGSKAQVYAWIDDLAAGRVGGRPRGVLVVSSYLPELLGICDRIAVMHRGRLGQARPVSEWTEAALLAESVGAEAA